MSLTDEVNQTSEPQHETIEEADEEEAARNQEETRVPLVDVRETEEEGIPGVETEIERDNVEIPEADNEEGFAEGNQNPPGTETIPNQVANVVVTANERIPSP